MATFDGTDGVELISSFIDDDTNGSSYPAFEADDGRAAAKTFRNKDASLKNVDKYHLSQNKVYSGSILSSEITDEKSKDRYASEFHSASNNVKKKIKAEAEESNSDDDVDFVDLAIARDIHKEFVDTSLSSSYERKKLPLDKVDIALAQGDTPQLKENDAHDSLVANKYKFKEKTRPKHAPRAKFGWFDFLIGLAAITLFFVDIGTDIELAMHYCKQQLWVYGGVTAGFILGPSLVTSFLGLHWYLIDYNKEKEVLRKMQQKGLTPKGYQTPGYVWFLRFFFTLMQFGPVIRIIEYLYCGYKSQCKDLDIKERRRYFKFMLYEDVDSCLLRLFESFLEAAPQLTWQLYIVIDLKPKEDVVGTSMRAISLLSSWGSLALSLTSYHKSLRNSHQEKAKMSLKSLPFYFFWRASETGGRVLCLAMFASVYRLWVFLPLAFHWCFMSGWLIIQRTTFYKNQCLEKVFNVICGYVMIFCFLNLREGQTRFRFLLFYLIMYIENFFMLALWFAFTQDLGAWFHLWGFIVVVVLFVIHILFQLLYYRFFHPTKSIQVCLPCTRYVICSSVCYELEAKKGNAVDGIEIDVDNS